MWGGADREHGCVGGWSWAAGLNGVALLGEGRICHRCVVCACA